MELERAHERKKAALNLVKLEGHGIQVLPDLPDEVLEP